MKVFLYLYPGLPGCHSQGATEEEATENIVDAISEYLEVVEELSL
jgi:predicted RNase H-like HicB family nuclease